MVDNSLKNHLGFVDISKGIGVILVICSHVYYPLMEWSSPFFVPIFFFVSGYCTTREIRLKDKFVKLMVPYVIFQILLLCLYRHFRPLDFLGVIYARWCIYPLGIVPNYYLLDSGNAVLWFLPSMFCSFLLLKLIMKKNSMEKWFVLGCVIMSYLMSFLPMLLPWSLDTAFLMVLFLLYGNNVRKYRLLEKVSIVQILVLIVIYALAWAFSGEVNLSVRKYGTSLLILLIASLIGCFLTVYFSRQIEDLCFGNLLSKIGKQSLVLFALHLPAISVGRHLVAVCPFKMPPLAENALVVFLVLLIMYPLSLFVNRQITKVTYYFLSK